MEKRPKDFRELTLAAVDFVLLTIGAKIQRSASPTRWNEVRQSLITSLLTNPSNVSSGQLNEMKGKISRSTKNEFEKIISAMNNVMAVLRLREQTQPPECTILLNAARKYNEARMNMTDVNDSDWISFVRLVNEHETALNKFLEQMATTYERMNSLCQVIDFDDDGEYPPPT